MIRKYSQLACLGLLFTPITRAQTLVADSSETVAPRLRFETQPILRVDSSLVLIPAHVTTPTGESVMSLGKENFRLMEDNVEQTITEFTKDDAPVSVGILFDASASMAKKMPIASQAVAAFFKTANPEDEFFLVQFNDRAKLELSFTPDSGEVYTRVVRIKPSGKTSLLDAVQLGLKQMKEARNLRKALVILSDGGDNWSRHSVREVKSALIESDVRVFAMGIFGLDDSAKLSIEERNGPRLLDELAEQSGGRHHRVRNLNELSEVSTAIGNELRNEYLIGYHPLNASRDGKYRQIKLKLFVDSTLDLRTSYRRGYYAPIQ